MMAWLISSRLFWFSGWLWSSIRDSRRERQAHGTCFADWWWLCIGLSTLKSLKHFPTPLEHTKPPVLLVLLDIRGFLSYMASGNVWCIFWGVCCNFDRTYGVDVEDSESQDISIPRLFQAGIMLWHNCILCLGMTNRKLRTPLSPKAFASFASMTAAILGQFVI